MNGSSKRLFEAIIQANHAAVAGDTTAGLHPAEYLSELPLVALSCIDPRLNPLLPEVLGIPEEQFIWLRNAGNVITSSTSSTVRSLALACAVKGGKEIAILGHTDCQVAKTTTMQLLERLKELGIERHLLPDNLSEFFGMFASERQNVIKAVDLVRRSHLIGPKIPVQGLLVDINSGRLEWIVNGYQALETSASTWNEVVQSAEHTIDALKSFADFKIGEMKMPDTKIGEVVTKAEEWAKEKVHQLRVEPQSAQPAAPVPTPPKIPGPMAGRPRVHLPRKPR